MSTFIGFLYVLVVVSALLLIGIILIQPAKSGGMGAAFGGVGESVFGAKAGSHLTRATVVMTAIFFLLSLILASLIGHGARVGQADGVAEELMKTPVATAPAATPAATAPAGSK